MNGAVWETAEQCAAVVMTAQAAAEELGADDEDELAGGHVLVLGDPGNERYAVYGTPDQLRAAAVRALAATGRPWRVDRLGAPVPAADTDTTACPLCRSGGGACEGHGVAALRAEVHRLRAVLAWLQVQDVYDLTRRVKALGRAYGRASDTIWRLRVRAKADGPLPPSPRERALCGALRHLRARHSALVEHRVHGVMGMDDLQNTLAGITDTQRRIRRTVLAIRRARAGDPR